VFDFMAERVTSVGLERMTRIVCTMPGLKAAGARMAAIQAARLHDLALDDYAALHRSQREAEPDPPLIPGSTVHKAVALMAVAGAELTVAAWGPGRTFGHDMADHDRYSLANTLFGIGGRFVDDSRLQALRRLHELGHEVVVAHVDDDHGDRIFHGLPLNSAIRLGEIQCMLQLLEWGADERARVDDEEDYGVVLDLAQEDERHRPGSETMTVLRSAIARRQGYRALADAVMPDPGPASA
jgi:hypothetical protein